MQREDVERISLSAGEGEALVREIHRLTERAIKAEAERDAAFAAGTEEIRKRLEALPRLDPDQTDLPGERSKMVEQPGVGDYLERSAVLAALACPYEPHVIETPEGEHDGGDVLTPATKRRARQMSIFKPRP